MADILKKSKRKEGCKYISIIEQAKSAFKIAKLLNVNRNTINDDIRYLHKQIGTRINPDDIVSKMAK